MQGEQTTQLLGKLLDVAAIRHKVIANNIANVNTPGFRKSRVLFEDSLKRALAEGELDKVQHLRALVEESGAPAVRNDGNNVDIDREMVGLAVNALRHRAAGEALGFRIRGLRNAIREGR